MDQFDNLATVGGGVFSSVAAAAVGIGNDRLQRAVRRGDIVRLTRGWYAPRGRMRGSSEHRHLLRVRAMTSRFGPGVVATHHSALAVYGLPLLGADLDVVHVGSQQTPRTAHGQHHVLHVLPESTPLGEASPPAVSPAAAVVQAGLTLGPPAALVAADEALRRSRTDLLRGPARFGHTSPDELAGALVAYRRVPGVAAVAQVLQHADPRAESPGESLLRYALHLLRVPVEPQFVIPIGGQEYRADFRVTGTRILIEFARQTR